MVNNRYIHILFQSNDHHECRTSTLEVLHFYLHSANFFVLKAKRQLQKTPTSIGVEMNAILFPVQRVFKRPLNEE